MLAACSGPDDPAFNSETGANIYADSAKWLCLPEREDACDGDFSATIISPDGSATLEAFKANPDAPFDCFYVYPTVSTDLSGNSDWDVDVQETGVAGIQAARFREVCKVYAPVYRQITLTALAAQNSGITMDMDVPLADGDVKAAWDYYLKHYNAGRGVVLLGHSQGTYRLRTLIQEHIDGAPIQAQIIAAHLIGANLSVINGARTGGTFETMPVCDRQSQYGCFTSFVSFRETSPPPSDGRYGYAQSDDQTVVCVNPAAPEGGKTFLNAYVPSRKLLAGRTASSENAMRWSDQHPTVDTNFVKLPGLLSGECKQENGASYFAVSINADPNDPRTDNISGDLILGGELVREWGLHLVDVNLVLGDMVDMVRAQGAAYMDAQAR
jgi:hypothetical protein